MIRYESAIATTFGISMLRPAIRLGLLRNSTSGQTRYAKKIDSTSSRMIPVILEITHSTPPITSSTITMRSTTRVDGPYASTAALAAVAAVSLVVSLFTLLCRKDVQRHRVKAAHGGARLNLPRLVGRDCSVLETQPQTCRAWSDELPRRQVTMRPRHRAAKAPIDRRS